MHWTENKIRKKKFPFIHNFPYDKENIYYFCGTHLRSSSGFQAELNWRCWTLKYTGSSCVFKLMPRVLRHSWHKQDPEYGSWYHRFIICILLTQNVHSYRLTELNSGLWLVRKVRSAALALVQLQMYINFNSHVILSIVPASPLKVPTLEPPSIHVFVSVREIITY